MFCKKCGEDVPDDSQFCPFCAEEIKQASVPAEPAPPAAPVPEQPQPTATAPMQPQQPPAPAPQPPPPTYQQPAAPPQYAAAPAPAKSSGSGALVAVIVAVVAVVLVVGGIGAYVVMKKLCPTPSVPTTADVAVTAPPETPTPPPSAAPIYETPATPSTAPATSGGAISGGSGSASAEDGLDDLIGVWQVDMAFLDGPPPETLTIERNGDMVVGTLNDRINTHLDLHDANGKFEGTWTDPQVGTVPVEAWLAPEGTLDILLLEGNNEADLLMSVYREESGL